MTDKDPVKMLRDSSLVGQSVIEQVERAFRNLSVLSETSADALGAIVDLFACSAQVQNGQSALRFGQESIDMLRGVGLWPLTPDQFAVAYNGIFLDRESGLYVWRDPKRDGNAAAPVA